jgi:hypothetical protein
MLAALQAHGRAMFGLAGPEDAESSVQAASRSLGSGRSEQDSEGEGEDYQSDDGWAAEDGFVSDSEDELVMLPPGKQNLLPHLRGLCDCLLQSARPKWYLRYFSHRLSPVHPMLYPKPNGEPSSSVSHLNLRLKS